MTSSLTELESPTSRATLEQAPADEQPELELSSSELKKSGSPWNSLEVAKLGVGLLTPILVVTLGFLINDRFRLADATAQRRATDEIQRQKEVDDSKQKTTSGQSAVGDLSKFMYERRTRSDMLRSSIVRYSQHRNEDFKSELLDRKRQYDETFVSWNRNTQANLLQIRKVLDSSTYTSFENLFEVRIVLQTFKPIHVCLGNAYESVILGADPIPILKTCAMDEKLDRLLNCSYAITDELYRLTFPTSSARASIVNERCPNEPRKPTQ